MWHGFYKSRAYVASPRFSISCAPERAMGHPASSAFLQAARDNPRNDRPDKYCLRPKREYSRGGHA